MHFVIHYTKPTLKYKWEKISEVISIKLMDETEALSIQPLKFLLYFTKDRQCITGRTVLNI
jgi:arginine deiminase